ncbi:MAG: response regulator transcription factor [Clostridia bacterium]|nr:response regulator transcription factor [Clostridia bacterium]MBR5743576.1 response regulator transcription factor [Clostridia bacterium]
MPTILLTEDDPAIVGTLSEFLKTEGFQTETAAGESEAVGKLLKNRYDLLLVDLALREGDGFGVCRAARERGLPVIFLTASGDEDAVVRGLDMGAEDYIVKPFRPRELVSRIRRVLLRAGGEDGRIVLGELILDPERGTVTRAGEEIALSALEYRLLLLFLSNRGRLLTRERLLEDIWDAAGDFVNDNTLTVYIKRLREKIEKDPQNPAVIKTVRGMGYRVD